MKALRLVEIGSPLEIQDVPAPEIREDDERDDVQVIVRVKACGLCGTDLHQIAGTATVSSLPITLGHEIAGVVEGVGRAISGGSVGVPTFKAGDRVAVNNVIWCGECRPCLRGRYNFCHNGLFFGRHVDGGLAEYVKVPARNLTLLPRNVSFEEGAILGCAVTTAYHALRIGRIAQGDSVVVWGLGGVGLALIQLARELSAAYPLIAVDIQEEKVRLASELGADFAINARQRDPVQAIKELTHGEGADAVYDTAGINQLASTGELITLASVCSGGRLIGVATFGAPVTVEPHDDLGVFEKSFTGSCGNLPDELEYLVQVVAGRRRLDLRKLITQMIDLEQANEIIETWRAGTDLVIRPVVVF
jgi:D-arabinose 1-dehydrogenase-like Zn-dependent alcohol dehydrogenase